MSMNADLLVERRQLRRRLLLWRVLALLIFVGALIVGVSFSNWAGGPQARPHIARLTVSGVIVDDRKRLELIRNIAESEAVKGVILGIDSPGGTVVGGEGLYDGLRALAKAKPTAAVIGDLGTSAGYMTAIASDHIVARRGSITGSIGVMFQSVEVSTLLERLGVNVTEIKSAPLKAAPSFSTPISPQAQAMLQSVIDDTHKWFVDIVAQRRNLEPQVARSLADGRIFTGNQALGEKLVDAVGGEDMAVTWLSTREGIDADMPVIDWQKPRGWRELLEGETALARVASAIASALTGGLSASVPERFKLDGLVAIWHPALMERL